MLAAIIIPTARRRQGPRPRRYDVSGVTAGRKAYDDYIANRYHQPSDAFDPNWDLSGMVQDLRLLYMVGSKLSTRTTPFPQWKPGSDFRRPGVEAK